MHEVAYTWKQWSCNVPHVFHWTKLKTLAPLLSFTLCHEQVSRYRELSTRFAKQRNPLVRLVWAIECCSIRTIRTPVNQGKVARQHACVSDGEKLWPNRTSLDSVYTNHKTWTMFCLHFTEWQLDIYDAKTASHCKNLATWCHVMNSRHLSISTGSRNMSLWKIWRTWSPCRQACRSKWQQSCQAAVWAPTPPCAGPDRSSGTRSTQSKVRAHTGRAL